MSCPNKISKQGYFLRKKFSFVCFPEKRHKQDGQALIVILLVSAIGLTLGLTLASRSTEETSITTELEESSRAFSAAEAGLEDSIQHIGGGTGVYTGSIGSGGLQADYKVEVEIAAGKIGPFQFPGEIENNQTVTVWLTGHATSGEIEWSNQYGIDRIDVCWGGSDNPKAALEMTYYSRTVAGANINYYIARKVYQPSDTSSIVEGAQSVGPASGKVCGGDYSYEVTVDLTNMEGEVGTQKGFLRIRPIFSTSVSNGRTRLAVDPGDNTTILPTQGELHISTGTTSTGQQTKIVQFISHPGPPELFDAVIFSERELSK